MLRRSSGRAASLCSAPGRGWVRLLVSSLAALGVGMIALTGMLVGSGGRVSAGNVPAPALRLTASSNPGYWLVASDGGIFPFGSAGGFGSTGGIHLNKPIVGMAATADGGGYWLVASDGGIFPFGDAVGFGSTGAIHLNRPIVAMAVTPDGGGYWLVASDGGIFPFGNAVGFGSTGGIHLNQPIVGMAVTPDGGGYWLVASDGGIFPFGDAAGYGSTGAIHLNKPIVAIAATRDGRGYWLIASDGGIFPFGDAVGYGSTGGIHLNQPIVGAAVTPDGGGYWLVASDGGIFPFGDAPGLGSTGGTHLNKPIVAMSATPLSTGVPGPSLPFVVQLSAGASTVTADGTSTVPVSATVSDQLGHPVSGDPVSFAVTGSGCGNVAPASATTDTSGAAATVFTASTSVASCVVRAVETADGRSNSVTITQHAGPPASVSATPAGATGDTADTGAAGIPVSFTVTDANGNALAGQALAISTTLAHGSVASSATTDAQGMATATLHDTTAGDSGTVTATVPSGPSGHTGTISIVPGARSLLVVSTQPSNAASTATITPSPRFTIEDAHGNVVTGATDAVSVSLGSNPGGGTLSGTLTRAASGGVASFNDLSIDKAGSGYTLHATDGSLSPATTSGFAITPGPVTQLAFGTQPSNSTGGGTIAPAVTVRELDASQNLVTSAADSISIAIDNHGGPGTLGGTLTRSASGGVATFNDLHIDKVGTGYTLQASRGMSLTSPASNPFNVVAGAASQLAFGQEPTTTQSTQSITPAITVKEFDAGGNPVSDSNSITLAIANNAGSPAGHLSGTLTQPTSGGVATFSGLSIERTGTGYTLSAAASGLTSATSTGFDITPGPIHQLGFSVQPTATNAAQPITPAVEVEVQDASGNLVPTATNGISLAIGPGSPAGTLSGTTSKVASGGKADFSDLSIATAGSGYTLVASSTGLPDKTSAPFVINANAATKLVFVAMHEPTNTTGGTTFNPTVEVSEEDSIGNVVTSDADPITIAIQNNPGPGTLSGTLVRQAQSGVASFPGISIDKVANGYTLKASSGSLTDAVSTSFNVTLGAASQLVFTQQPSASTTAGMAFATQPIVQEEDAGGNLETTDNTSTVSLAIGTNPGSGTLSGTKTVTVAGGVATFSGLSVDKAGSGYTLNATSSPALPTTGSAPFAITPDVPTQLVFTTQPVDTHAGSAISPAVQVAVEDAHFNVETGDNATTVTVGIGTNPGSSTLTGTTMHTVVNGVASFNDLSLNKTDTGYTLSATSSPSHGTTPSSPFAITPGAPTQLVFTTPPVDTAAGSHVTPAVQVSVEDADNNVETADNATMVTLAIGTNPGSGTLSGTLTRTAMSGVATFDDLSINKTGTGYTLSATSSPAHGTTPSGTFTINPGTPTQLVFTVQPSSTDAASTAFPTQPSVAVEDADNNVETGDNSTMVTLAISTPNPNGGTLSCTHTTLTVSSGVAAFAHCAVDKVGSGYTLTASSSPAHGTPSSTPFTVTAGTPTQLVFTTQPGDTGHGQTITPAVHVAVEDAGGNVETGDNSTVITMAIGTNPSSGTLSGTLSHMVTSGVATFSDLSINNAGTGYTLSPSSSPSYTSAPSGAFNIIGDPTKLAFTSPPTDTVVGKTINAVGGVVVAIEDVNGHVVPSATNNIQVAVNKSSLTGTTVQSPSSGAATFPDLKISSTSTDTGYTLTASSTGLTPATSAPFATTPDVATKLILTSTSPQYNAATHTLTPNAGEAVTFTVTLEDQYGNTETGSSDSVTVTLTPSSAAGKVADGGNLNGGTSDSSGTQMGTGPLISGAASFTYNAPGMLMFPPAGTGAGTLDAHDNANGLNATQVTITD